MNMIDSLLSILSLGRRKVRVDWKLVFKLPVGSCFILVVAKLTRVDLLIEYLLSQGACSWLIQPRSLDHLSTDFLLVI